MVICIAEEFLLKSILVPCDKKETREKTLFMLKNWLEPKICQFDMIVLHCKERCFRLLQHAMKEKQKRTKGKPGQHKKKGYIIRRRNLQPFVGSLLVYSF